MQYYVPLGNTLFLLYDGLFGSVVYFYRFLMPVPRPCLILVGDG